MNEKFKETCVVLSVLDGPVPDGRVYTELESHEVAIIVDSLDSWLDSLITTKKDLIPDERKFHQEYIEEVAATLEKIREFNK